MDPVHKRILMEQLAADLWREGEKEMSPDALDLWLDQFLSEHRFISDAYASTNRFILKEDFRTACFVLRDDQRVDNNASSSSTDVRSSFRFAHSSLQEFFLAAWLWHGLTAGNLQAFDLPMVSIETLDFLGQLLELDSDRQRAKALLQLDRVLEGENLVAATIAFRYWLRAIERGMPVLKPSKVNLGGANLEEWTLRGRGPTERLDLRNACFRGAQLNRARLEWIDLTAADMSQVAMRQAVLCDVQAESSSWVGADLSGSQWRIGSLRRADLAQARVDCELVHVEGIELSDMPAHPPTHFSRTEGPFAFTGYSSSVSSCAWSPNGLHILSGSADNTLKLWDVHTGTCIRTLSGHSWYILSCAWSPDGLQILSGALDNTFKLWDVHTGACLRTLNGHSLSVTVHGLCP